MIHRIRERGGGGVWGGECVKLVRVPVCYQLSRRVAGCPRFWTKSHWLPSAQTISTRQFSSSATTGMGENSPTTYTLQGSSLKTRVNFHPRRPPHQICIFYYFKFFFISQTYTIFSKHKRGKVVDKVMKFPFCNSNIYGVTNFLMNLWVNFHPLRTAKVNGFQYKILLSEVRYIYIAILSIMSLSN